MDIEVIESKRWSDLYNLMMRGSKFAQPSHEPSEELK